MSASPSDHASVPPRFTNRLAREKSPYLLQHAHNPVNWQPWDTEALEQARTENKPIFLSIGYSACHWCHVMERESFENEATARLLNDHFVSIKVDREERPDVDEIYMTAVQMMTGHGGWPMSVFLTPDGRPFYGGTYFPPTPGRGRIAFPDLVTQLADAYHNRKEEVEQIADSILEELQKAARQRPVATHQGHLDPEHLLRRAVGDLTNRFDEDNGGFNESGPKFPPHHALRLLSAAIERGDTDEAVPLWLTTLDKMAMGGIYDHVGGGFHRYSTDAKWLLPHFEKMLYDNALLARVYAQAFHITRRPAYGRITRETIDWVLRDLQDDAGGFHAALDADSEGDEGKYYVWTRDEVIQRLGPEDGEAFCERYNLLPGGNWREESTGHLTGTNIPHLAVGPAAVTRLPLLDSLEPSLQKSLSTLLETRNGRVPPAKDDKVITSWNGLMIGALAVAGDALKEQRYIDAARRAADFCLTTLRPSGQLLRRYAQGEAGLAGYLDDHAFLADGLLDLYDTTGEERWLREARSLADALLTHFWDSEDTGFFFAGREHEALVAASKDLYDGALPSANGVAVRVLARLGKQRDGERYAEKAREMLTAYQGLLEQTPQVMHTLILASLDAFSSPAADASAGVLDHAPADHPPVVLSAAGEHTLRLKPGKTGEAIFHLRIAPNYHVNSQHSSSEYLIPTTATFSSDVPAAAGPIVYPIATSWHSPMGETLSVYQGEVPFVVPVAVPTNAVPGSYHLTLTVRCQPCSESACLAPQEQTAAVTVVIE
ncbi:MAG: thioredoxin domain-containing protein [Armatimonadota bacterium]